MITLYKQIETKGLYYKEMWYENADKVLIGILTASNGVRKLSWSGE